CLGIYHLLLSHRGEVIRKVSEIDVPHSSTTAPIKPKTCKICGSIDNCDFKVMDDVWRTTIPIEYRNDIVCGKCFENFAAEKQIQLLRRKVRLFLPLEELALTVAPNGSFIFRDVPIK